MNFTQFERNENWRNKKQKVLMFHFSSAKISKLKMILFNDAFIEHFVENRETDKSDYNPGMYIGDLIDK